MSNGTVKWFNQKKGFGFIVDNETKKDTFVHITDIISGVIKEGDKTEYTIIETKYGKKATKVKII